MIYPKFLVIRFPVGAAGNLLSSCLQCSQGVGHWSTKLEYSKPTVNWLDYFKQVFQPNYDDWFKNEPSIQYSLGVKEIYSAYYDRGNNLSREEFLEAEKKCNHHYHSLKEENKYIPVFWHKQFFPLYYTNATFIDIFLDKDSLKWYDKSHYRKHYKVEYKNNQYKVYNKRHLPGTIPTSFTGSNPYITYYDTFHKFAREEIFNNPHRKLFVDKTIFDKYSNDRPRYTLELSDILNQTKFLENYYKMCELLNVTPLPFFEIKNLHQHWLNCHDF
jgi:hypothetical protein